MSLFATAFRKAHTAALLAFRRLPAPVRRSLVRMGTPGYTVGAVCVVEHEGRMLFLRQPHRHGWSLPGGLLKRGENAAAGVEREVYEETGLRIKVGRPVLTEVHPRVRRVDVIFRVATESRPDVRVGGEAKDYRWWRPDELPGADDSTRDILAALAAEEPDHGRILASGDR
ncbi:MAG: NUDIX hydrolase [Actinomycetes bacterium]